MKYFLTVIWGIICVSVLAYGHFHWNQQTAVQAVEPVFSQDTSEIDHDDYLELAANWPEPAKEQLKVALEHNQPFKIAFVGSTAMDWAKNVSQSLSDSFGSDRIHTAQFTYDQTTKDLIAENKQVEIAAEKAQLVVIEPFLFNDNGKLKINATLANVTKLMEDIKTTNPDTTFILQPSYPIYLPQYYSVQVEGLKQFAAENTITYLDHWTAWPATDNPELQEFLTEGENGPNDNGNQVWAQFLVDYFVNKKAD